MRIYTCSSICSSLLFVTLGVSASAEVYFHETFDDATWKDRWVLGTWKEGDSKQGTFDLSNGQYHADEKADMSLKTTEDSKYYTATAAFPKMDATDKTLVLQYQVKNEQAIECGGAYLKFGPKIESQKDFTGDTAYSIMFGPDICGSVTRKTHVIFSYKGKNLDKKKDVEVKNDHFTHLYTLIVKPDGTYEVQIDMKKVASGVLLEDWDFLPPKQIKDPEVSKPTDWVNEKEIDDPEDKKPEDWSDEKKIKDPKAEKPTDWDDEEDGEWQAPMINNPDFKGEWKAKKIPNPEYKGEWEHPMIDNPDYSEDKDVGKYNDISMVGIDIWQVKAGTLFDNILVTDDVEKAKELAEKYFVPLSKVEKEKKEEDDKKKKEEEDKKQKEEEEKAKANKDDDDEEDDDENEASEDKIEEDEKDDEKEEL